MKASEANQQDTKWVFIKKGTCSRTLFYILNREFNHALENEERAADPMAGGIMQHGYQCGLLWGAAMAVGAESLRRCESLDQAIALAIKTTQDLIDSFSKRAGSVDCLDITEADFASKSSFARYMVSGKFLSCFKLTDKWAPESIRVAKEAFSQDPSDLPRKCKSCASEVVRKMGGSDEEVSIVAGLAGGLGLSGNACGALSAAIWMKSLAWSREHPGKSTFSNPEATKVLETFLKATDYEFMCSEICEKIFDSVSDHTEFIENGGCSTLINTLAK